jgi:hypothetical protein
VQEKGTQSCFKHEVDVRRTENDVLNGDAWVWIIQLPHETQDERRERSGKGKDPAKLLAIGHQEASCGVTQNKEQSEEN